MHKPNPRPLAGILQILTPALLLLLTWLAIPSPALPPSPTQPQSPDPTPSHPKQTPQNTKSTSHTRPATQNDHAIRQLIATQWANGAIAKASAGTPLSPDFLEHATSGQSFAFKLPDGTQIAGHITSAEHNAFGISHIHGQSNDSPPATVFIQRQRSQGVAGPFVGHVRFPDQSHAWKIEPSPDGTSARFVKRPLDEVLCINYLATAPPPTSADPTDSIANAPQSHPTQIAIPPYQTVIPLQSLPGATAVVYLDFDGEKGPFPGWGEFDAAPSGASNSQVFEVWKMVCEDFQPFNINITTDRKVFDEAPAGRRQQIIITPTNKASPGAGGVAYVGSFNWDTSRPCWSFYTTGKSACEVISHEIGHTLGLSHDGRSSPSEEYYGGHGSGDTGWAPIMGTGYSKTLTQWSKGEYLNANRSQDDLNIISSDNNAVAYRADDAGTTLDSAAWLEIQSNNAVSNEGFIGTTGDVDAFRFTTTGGTVTLNINPVSANPNLDIAAELVNATTHTTLATNNPDLATNATLSASLTAGDYLLKIRGSGRGDPLADGYTNYASLGTYLITGTINGGIKPLRFTLAENAPSGTTVGTITPRLNHGTNTLTFAITSGNALNAFTLNPSTGTLTLNTPSAINFESLSSRWEDPATIELFVDLTDLTNPALNESLRVVVTATNVNEPPTLTTTSATVLERTLPDTRVVQVRASDPDPFDFPTFAITAGNTDNAFTIDPGSGWISISANLEVPSTTTRNLTVTATDQGSSKLSASATIPITIVKTVPGYQPGRIVRTYFENITGSSISNLTSNTRFPNNPDSEEFLNNFDGSSHGDNYGSTIRGYLIAPTTGSYQFWLASDDGGELRISNTSNPSGATTRATVSGWTDPYEWTKSTSQASQNISLTAGQAYYVEARQKEGGGGDHVAVAWSGPGIPRQIIPGLFLAPFKQNYAPSVEAATFTVRENALPGLTVGTVTPRDVNAQDAFSDHRITAGNSAGIFAIDPATGRITIAKAGLLNAATTPTFTLTVATTDNASPPLSGTGTITINVKPATGVTLPAIAREVWTGISGDKLTNLTGNANYPAKPNTRVNLTDFDSGEDYADNYGSRVRALFTAPSTGSYVFYISGDDETELYYSSSTSGSGASRIAYVGGYSSYRTWDKEPSQRSTSRPLTAGQQVYLEVRHKEGGGGDHLSVGYTGPGTTNITIIPGSMLKPFNINLPPQFSPSSYAFNLNGGNATTGTPIGRVNATDPNAEPITLAITAGNPQETFAIDPATGSLSVANPATLTDGDAILTVAAQDTGLGADYPLASATATVTIRVTGMRAPPVFLTNPIALTGPTENVPFSGSLAAYASDPNPGDTLTFAKLSGPDWLHLAPNGTLSGTPLDADTGDNGFEIQVTDSTGLSATAELYVTVTGVDHPPDFTNTPYRILAVADHPVSGALSASDADPSDWLFFSKTSGPGWLGIATHGALYGTPFTSASGENTFTIRVTDATGLYAETTLTALVAPCPTWTQPTSGFWSAPSHWFAGVVPDGPGTSVDFSTLDLTEDTTVTLDQPRTAGKLVFGDTTPSHGWSLNGAPTTPLTLNGGTELPVISVVSGSTRITAPLTGNAGFTKKGTGSLILAGNHPYSGTTNLAAGSLLIEGRTDNTQVTVHPNATLGGQGTVHGNILIHGTLLTGNPLTGALTTTGTLTLAPRSTLLWQPSQDNPTAPSCQQLLLTATPENPITIILPNDPPSPNPGGTLCHTLSQTNTPITNFNSASFLIDPSNLAFDHSSWTIEATGNVLELVHSMPGTPAPDANQNGLPDAWETEHFGNADPDTHPPLDDPDHDGIPNLLEFALLTPPTTPNASPIRQEIVTIDGLSYLRLTIPRNPGAAYLTFTPESSGDASSWSTTNAIIEIDTPDLLVVRDPIPQQSSPARFLRLALSLPQPPAENIQTP